MSDVLAMNSGVLIGLTAANCQDSGKRKKPIFFKEKEREEEHVYDVGFRFENSKAIDLFLCRRLFLRIEDCLHRLQTRIEVTYEASRPEHQEALRALWHAAFPEEELHGLISEQWKEMGWQGKDPSTDFRGGGFISLENLLFFAKTYPKSFRDLLWKQEGNRAMWEYPFAVAGVNITFMLIQILDLQAAKPRTMMGAAFLKLLAENEWAFDLLYCITFKLMDQQWLAMHASYMDFNSVMKSTRSQLEKELLSEDITRLEDLPSYSLLRR